MYICYSDPCISIDFFNMVHNFGSINVNEEEKEVFLHVGSLGHAALLFVNKRLEGYDQILPF